MGNVTAIPEYAANVTADERKEYEDFRSGADNLYEPGITNIPNAYDQYAGSKYNKTAKPEYVPGPLLATDEGQPQDVKANEVSRNRNKAVERNSGESKDSVDSTPQRVVSSKDKVTGRKSN